MFRRSAHYKICKTVTLITIFLQQFIHAYNMMKNVYYGYGPFVVKKIPRLVFNGLYLTWQMKNECEDIKCISNINYTQV